MNVSSIMAVKGSLAATAAAYAASKAGVIGFTRPLTAECSYMMSIGKIEDRIRVNTLLAGYINGVRNIGQFKLPGMAATTSNTPGALRRHIFCLVQTQAFCI
jgi:NAD(P)-dependent dehydrogenase (short-subunit alcohol dehydrogenase family)